MGKTRGTPVVLVRNKGVLRNLAEKEGSGEKGATPMSDKFYSSRAAQRHQ